MSSTIVVLLIWLIAIQVALFLRDSLTATKESEINFYKNKIDECEKSKVNKPIAFLLVFITRCVVVYYAVISILSFVK